MSNKSNPSQAYKKEHLPSPILNTITATTLIITLFMRKCN